MKYLLFEDPSGHEEMRDQMPYGTVLSGGFIQIDGGRIVCHGQAKDLNLQAREEDAEIVGRHFRTDDGD